MNGFSFFCLVKNASAFSVVNSFQSVDKRYMRVYLIKKVGNPTLHTEGEKMEALKDYTVHIDGKKRVTLRGAAYQYYHVKEYDNGCIILEPRELVTPDTISKKTLEEMDEAIKNFKKNTVSPPIDLSDF